ncbi:MAG: PLDc N-terminal domain-containing protein [Streptosporangiaceae bacterium]
MSGAPAIRRTGEMLIRAACRRLPAGPRAERYREWTAELPAILDDTTIRWRAVRALRMLAFCAGIYRTTRRLNRSAGSDSRRNARWRSGGPPGRPSEMAARAVAGLAAGLVVVAGLIALIVVLGTGSHPDLRPLLLFVPLGLGFAGYCVADVVRATEVRYLPKWAWALICLVQIPLGGILYLTIGRIGPTGSAPPRSR